MNNIPIDFVGCNVHDTDRFNIDYKLTEAEKNSAFLYPNFSVWWIIYDVSLDVPCGNRLKINIKRY